MLTSVLQEVSASFLLEGRKRFAMDVGIISRVDQGQYHIIFVSDSNNALEPGIELPLGETYCRDVIAQRRTIAITELAGEKGLAKHPLYSSNPLEAYIAAPIMVGSLPWGTVNFSCSRVRAEHFSRDDIHFIESAAKTLSEFL